MPELTHPARRACAGLSGSRKAIFRTTLWKFYESLIKSYITCIYIRYITCISQNITGVFPQNQFQPHDFDGKFSDVDGLLGEMVTGHLQRASGTTVWEA